MNTEHLLLALPLIPLFLLAISLVAKVGFRRDLTPLAIPVNHVLQALVGVGLWLRFHSAADSLSVPLSVFPHPIVFSFDRFRLYFLAAYLIPLLFSLFRLRRLDSPELRTVFLFYLAGCSGLLVTGDIFNFFVFYEMMIMAAYVLIAARRLFYASVKYMLINAVSSVLLLSGIIVLYASGAMFEFDYAPSARSWTLDNRTWLLVFFTSAFLVKSAFFPASGWIAGCHSATHGVISAFLGSFTVFSGVFGLIYLVLNPAAALGMETPFRLLRALSWVALPMAALFMFFEPEPKRVVAGSTVLAVGWVGLLLASGWTEAALIYLALHALYKSAMFYLLDEMEVQALEVRARSGTWALVLPGILFSVGAFPAAGYFLKTPLLEGGWAVRFVFMATLFLSTAAFFKFRPRLAATPKAGRGWALPVAPILLGATLWIARRPGIFSLLVEWAIILAAAVWAAPLFARFSRWARLDRRWVFGDLNRELFYILALFAIVLAYFWADVGAGPAG
ncbi:MAG: proton-conducting transporter membrane subunit [Kiritimatiellia bacterium]|nr:proton-conducting transporter membrane subunit [Kiritimatiellia bacterium]